MKGEKGDRAKRRMAPDPTQMIAKERYNSARPSEGGESQIGQKVSAFTKRSSYARFKDFFRRTDLGGTWKGVPSTAEAGPHLSPAL